MQWPSLDKLPLIDLSSNSLMSFSAWGMSGGMLNFYDPARSTTRNYTIIKLTFDITTSCYFVSGLTTNFSYFTWKIEWERELLILADVALVARFYINYLVPLCLRPKSLSLLSCSTLRLPKAH